MDSTEEEEEEEEVAAVSQKRVKTLRVLTVQFVELLGQCTGGQLDLKDATKHMDVRQVRRLYDVTNVLEGIGLIVKVSKGTVMWIGTAPGENVIQLNHRLAQLRSEVEELELKEMMLDQQRQWVEESVRNTTDDWGELIYVNCEDIFDCFNGHTLLAVQAPSGTLIDVPIPKSVPNTSAQYQIYLKSKRGPIDVMLLNKLNAGSAPLVLPLPPSEEIRRAATRMRSRQMATENAKPPQAPPLIKTEPNGSQASLFQSFSEELKNLLDPSKEVKKTDIITRLMTTEVMSSFFQAPSTPAPEPKHLYHVDDTPV